MKLRSSWPVVASTMRSIRGRGKLSLGHARLTSVKSMHRRHFPFAFLSSTTLANHSGVFHFSDRTCLEELADLLINRFLSFWSETSSFLLDWFEGWTDA